MKASYRICVLLLLLSFVVPVQSVLGNGAEGWTPVGPGVDFQEFVLPGPIHAYVARMDIHNPEVTIDSSIAAGELSSGVENVSSMATRYDQAINYWGSSWGARNRVLVAINGSYTDGPASTPLSGMVHSGWYAKRFDNMNPWSGFSWHFDRTAFIGKCAFTPVGRQLLSFLDTGETQIINSVNTSRGFDDLILYTPQFGSRTLTDDSGVDVLVEMTGPTTLTAHPNLVRGYVRSVEDFNGNIQIPFDHIVLSAHGAARNELLNHLTVGDEIGISQEITHTDEECHTPYSPDWSNTYASIAGEPSFLRDGEIFSIGDPNARHPRTAVALNDDFIFFIVVDGRNQDHSIGMTFTELGDFSKNVLGATWGIAEDGGGSSTMVINGAVVNHPVSLCHFEHSIYFPFVTQSSSGFGENSQPPYGPFEVTGSSLYHCQREVPNGLMMIAVEQKVSSNTFSGEDKISTRQPTEIRLGPGTNYAVMAVIPPAAQGKIIPHQNNLDGVLAKGSYWWKVNFNGVVGWAAEESLIKYNIQAIQDHPWY